MGDAGLASRRVAEKVGMTLEQAVRTWNKEICVYAIGRETTV